ncbi:hypothetical protein NUU61_000922 [Penicillium alfredii]|uniref:TECPR1-like DysF domain-containing protein n=1 Tax=Penicillium alfredii TaxID=1506179 RepID=A0A9W9GAK1_9EURO|nr:uncharacterized protein NUU61_000922 [Penicillium alfredii]KAJ5115163.1 hypothetical protein NUU61_000922 [Penicillium alfredii]
MDEYTPEALVNRQEPIPVFSTPKPRQQSGSPASLHSRSSSQSKSSLQDRLFAKLLQQVIPHDDEDETDSSGDKAFSTSPKRPAFSLPTMTNNFRRFNARIGVVFLFQNRVERLLSWKKPTHTLSLLFVYSFICLDPHLLLVLPVVVLLLFIMVPAFVARHPPPPTTSTSSTTPYYSYDGPALAPARTIRPAPETSKDFFRNMRDLQNCMADFSDIHDATIAVFAPLTNFSNEKLSSTIFLGCTIATVVLFISAHLLPLRLVLLAGGNAAILSSHPTIRQFFQDIVHDVGVGTPELGSPVSEDVPGVSVPATPSAAMSAMESLADISVDSDPEEREVEIFEVQHRAPGTSESGWENFIFSPLPYDPLSPSRIAGDRPRGCRFFEDVRPPYGWAWKSKKWELDLDCREWVVERMITGVGFEIPGVTAEGNAITDEVGGWVWDLPPSPLSREDDEEITTLAYGDLQPEVPTPQSKGGSISKNTDKEKPSARDWEEAAPASYGIGEWRRRRWVRVVQRMSLPPPEVVTYSTLGHG